jgi:hypothetical protein
VIAVGTVEGPVFEHLHRLTDRRGLFEHALHGDPRPEHGYCVDDVSRALLVVCREQRPGPELKLVGRRYLDFTLAAVQPDGSCHNRMSIDGEWSDEPGLGDWWGRALWGLGVAAAKAPTQAMRARALLGFRTAARSRSPHLRGLVFAALGAGELLLSRPAELAAQELLRDAVAAIGVEPGDVTWPWPEARLSYGNGSVVQALLLAGAVLPDPAAHARGLELLDFLLRTETRDGHLSVTPVGGRGPGDVGPGFDQQPIEVAALADACALAFTLTSDPHWLDGVQLAWSWFLGDNDASTPMFDPATGAGFDGLQADGCNLNQGAESTLALLSTAQHAQRLGLLE